MAGKIPFASEGQPLLVVEDLKKYFPVRGLFFTRGWVRAVDGVTFAIPKGKTLGLVGESGSGKTTVGRLVLRLLKPTSGRIIFDGKDITWLSERKLKWFRRRAQIVFQDPYMSLNPRMTVYEILLEPLKVHKIDVENPREYIVKLLHEVGLDETHLYRYPYAFSGGQRQRIAIARALYIEPEMLVLDEATSALDDETEKAIMDEIYKISDDKTLIIIAHRLSTIDRCEKVYKLENGEIVNVQQ